MPASTLLKVMGLLTALAIATVAIWYVPAAPRPDAYSATVKLAAGALAVIGSLYLAHAVGSTFLSGGGRGHSRHSTGPLLRLRARASPRRPHAWSRQMYRWPPKRHLWRSPAPGSCYYHIQEDGEWK